MLAKKSLIAAVLLMATGVTRAQVMTNAERAASAGDSDTVVATSAKLSPKLTKKNVRLALKLVADWQLDRARTKFNQDWTYATLYAGFMAHPSAVGGAKYQDAMREFGRKSGYIMGPAIENSNNQAVGRTYTLLYEKDKDPAMIGPAAERAQHLLLHVDNRTSCYGTGATLSSWGPPLGLRLLVFWPPPAIAPIV